LISAQEFIAADLRIISPSLEDPWTQLRIDSWRHPDWSDTS
jgi:hypothetical protein